jgi:multiple sugar transport system permease protein
LKLIGRIIAYIALAFLAAICLFPLAYTFANSFIGGAEYAKYYGRIHDAASKINPLHLIPDVITLEGFYEMLFRRPDYLMKFWTSLGLCAAIVSGQLVLSVLGGYAFAKFRFPGRDAIFFVIIVLMMMPHQVTLVPNHIILDAMGLIGNHLSLILPGIFSAFGLFFLRQVFATLPDELLDAAKIDGAGSFRALTRVLLPNAKAGIAALGVLGFIDCWNMVEQPLVFLKSTYQYPLSVFLLQVNSMQPALGFACGLLSIAPAVLLFLFFKDEMVDGIGYSVIK